MNTTNNLVNEIDFNKTNNLVPTIIQEENGSVLSLVYSNRESLEKTIQTNFVWTYSRERKGVFKKGATSKNTQSIIKIKKDCDNDSLLFIVKQNGTCACHTGEYSCFGEKDTFTLEDLFNKIVSRTKNAPESSTKQLLNDPLLLKRKLVEEAAEVITAKDTKNLIWECSDLIYFLFVIMAKEGINLKDINLENKRRDNNKKETEVNK
jgi:phosphoribosyl-ATP pyrophosphohydrolase